MGSKQVWTNDSRVELRESLRSAILGHLRLAKLRQGDLLEFCREVYIEDECPENERSEFTSFAAEEIKRGLALLDAEKIAWPKETDCDRLDRVEGALRERGILLWQASPCCDSCTGAELPDRIDVINNRYPGFRERVRGYAFFIDQNLPEMLAENSRMSVYLAYGWFSSDDSEVAPDAYETNALAVAHEVCEWLRGEGFEVNWDGDYARKIEVSLNWQRRLVLE
jgi:hypothetical protein